MRDARCFQAARGNRIDESLATATADLALVLPPAASETCAALRCCRPVQCGKRELSMPAAIAPSETEGAGPGALGSRLRRKQRKVRLSGQVCLCLQKSALFFYTVHGSFISGLSAAAKAAVALRFTPAGVVFSARRKEKGGGFALPQWGAERLIVPAFS